VTWAPDYITLANLKSWLRVTDTVDDAEFPVWITAASRAIDRATNRQFGQVAAPVATVYRRAPVYDPTTGLFVLRIDDVQTTTGLLVNGVAYASSGATLLPDDAPLRGVPWTALGLLSWPTLSSPGAPVINTITAQWGWTSTPVQVTAACRLQVSRWNFRRDSPAGVAGSPDQGSEMRLLARLDPDVATTLSGLTRRRAVA
jgi:hypothetical protein